MAAPEELGSYRDLQITCRLGVNCSRRRRTYQLIRHRRFDLAVAWNRPISVSVST